MLTYIISVTEKLLLLSVLTGQLLAFSWKTWQPHHRGVIGWGLGVSWVASAIFAVLKKTTRLIDNGLWNLRFVVVYLIGLAVFLVLLAPGVCRALKQRADLVQQLGVSFLIFGSTLYFAPDALTDVNAILLSVKSVISSDFFLRLVGWLAGMVLMLLLCLAVWKVLLALDDGYTIAMPAVGSVFVGLVLLGLALRAMLTRRIIPQSKALFKVAVFVSNNNLLFGCVMGLMAVGCTAMLVVRSLNVREPYDNPAQHRKIRAKWRNRRRWCAVAVVCLLCALLNVTVVKAYDSREVELSPSEEFEQRDDGCYIPLTQVEDGHLHRFTYESPNGVGIRFIIIKKPGGSSYGIGLDACDICGETGYYERDDQVVCKLCDVVMNIQTIGFKGGCNPIVIDYSIKDGYIIVPFETLLENEAIFTR